MTEFPKVLLVDIQSPIDHIKQGDGYGADLELAYAVHKSNIEKVETFISACDDGHEVSINDHHRREVIRDRLLNGEEED